IAVYPHERIKRLRVQPYARNLPTSRPFCGRLTKWRVPMTESRERARALFALAAVLSLTVPALAQAPAGPQHLHPQTPDAAPEQNPKRDALLDLAGIKAIRDVEYARPDNHALRLDVFVPEKSDAPLPGHTAPAPRPLVIWI